MSGATGYVVDEWTNGFWTPVDSTGSSGTSFTVNGLSVGITYFFEVGASNAAGTTWANSQSTTTLSPPATPSFTATPVSGTQINLAWTGGAGATSYLVEEQINAVWTQIGSTGQRRHQHRGRRLEPRYHLLFQSGGLQRGRHDLGESPDCHDHLSPPAVPSFTATPVPGRRSTWRGPVGPARPVTWSMNRSTPSGLRSAARAAAAPTSRSAA